MKLFYYISIILLFIGCENRKNFPALVEKQMKYKLYNYTDGAEKDTIFRLKIYENNGIDSIVVFSGNKNVFSYKYFFDSLGYHRLCKNEIVITHSLIDTLIHTLNVQCDIYPPFQNENIVYRNSKTYRFDENEFKIFHFIEYNRTHSNTYDSYYLENVGPICYYSFDTDQYIICDSLSGFKIDSRDLRRINSQLLNDSTFFSRYFLNKAMPEFHRPKF